MILQKYSFSIEKYFFQIKQGYICIVYFKNMIK